MNVSDEMLSAYVDGELDESARAMFETALVDDAELAARVAQQRALRARLQTAFDATLRETVPRKLLDSVRAPAAATTTGQPLAQPVQRPSKRLWSVSRTWFAMAASLLLGVLLGQRVLQQPGQQSRPIVASAAGLVAQGRLASALTEQLAEQGETDHVSVGISFLARSGEYCRTFLLRSEITGTGLACRVGDEWQIKLFDSEPVAGQEPAGSMRQAAAELPASVRLAVEARIAGEPLDRAGEARARSEGWQSR